MTGGADPAAAAAAYATEISRFFGPSEPVFDLVILGLGADGHTASLFPGTPAGGLTQWVLPARGGSPSLDRLTLTPALINRSREVLFLVSGRAKAETVRDLLEGRRPDLPAAAVRPVSGRLTWLLDREAACLLQKHPG